MRAISYSMLLLTVLFNPWRATHAVQTPLPVEFRNYEVINGFPDSLTFKVEVCNVPEKITVFLYYKIAQSGWMFSEYKFTDGLTNDGCQRRRASIVMKGEPPNLTIAYYWLVLGKFESGQAKSLQNSYLYEDPRFEWHILQDKDVAVHWHDRPEEFGKMAFDIAARSIEAQRNIYGTGLKYPAQIVIANTDEEFMSWQFAPNPDTGGLALPWYGMTIQIADENSSEDWLDEVLPHEISHLYLYQLTRYAEAIPPLWLDEGLAVYNEFGDHEYEYDIVREAVLQNRLVPLLPLRDAFGDEYDEVDLAYAESYYAVVYIMEVHGKEKLAQLLKAYERGKEQDEAFMFAFNQTIDEFEDDWETWIETKMRAEIPLSVTPQSQEQTSPAEPGGQAVLAVILFACCLSTAGLASLGLVVYLLKPAAKRSVDRSTRIDS